MLMGLVPGTQLRRRFIGAFLCVCVIVWMVVPTTSHIPKFLDAGQEQLQMFEAHGHSHGMADEMAHGMDLDLLWDMHGHQHDVADHDHNSAVLLKRGTGPEHGFQGATWRLTVADASSVGVNPPDRPPIQ